MKLIYEMSLYNVFYYVNNNYTIINIINMIFAHWQTKNIKKDLLRKKKLFTDCVDTNRLIIFKNEDICMKNKIHTHNFYGMSICDKKNI